MSIILYKSGSSYRSPKGIRCEFQICNPFSFEHLLKDGWFKTPEEVVKDEEKKAKEKVKVLEPEVEVKPKVKPEVKDSKAKIIEGLKAKKAELLANQDKE
jgi:hypothetical protein